MNDLMEVRDAWGQPDPPSRTAYSAARAALMRQAAAEGTSAPAPTPLRRRGVRLAWLTGAVATTASLAAAVAFAVAPGTPQPGQPADQVSGQSSGQPSGQQILLAAATVAEAKPAGTGAYWHVTQSVPPGEVDTGTHTYNTWTAHDGTLYVMPEDEAGVVPLSQGDGFPVGASRLTYGQLQQLPTDPAALKAWITDSFAHPSGPGAPDAEWALDIPAGAMPGTVANELSDLLWEVPAPPAVRAAAFRALASMPNVTNLGTVDGGRALRISFPPPPADKFPGGKLPAGADEMTLVIDPATSMLLSRTNYQGTHKILTAEWTNEMPKVVQPSHR